MTALALRRYQVDAVAAVDAAWARGVRRPAIVLPTGAGKTTVFSHIAHKYLSNGGARGRRVLVLAHRVELIDQAARRIRDADPDLRVGTVIADSDETDADVVVASIQTLSRAHRRRRITDVGLVICDEAHHASAKTYVATFDHFSDALFLGVTATMSRADGAALNKAWDEIVYELPILDLVRQGYLADVRGISVEVADLDLSGVRSTGGDFDEGQLGEAMEMSMAPEIVAAAYLEHASDRPGLLFAPTVAVAELMAEHLNRAGVVTEVVTGKTPKDERRAMLRRYESGRTQVLANCAVLTEGFDAPKTSCVVLARPTRSSSLFVQMVGRGLRTFPGKAGCLVLDVAGATAVNNLCSLSTLAGRAVKPGETLTEAEDRELEEERSTGARPETAPHAGPVGHREVDLFAGARRRWRKTAVGLPYLSTPIAYLFIFPGAPTEGWICEDADFDDECDGCYCHLGHAPCGHCENHYGSIPGDTYDIGWLATKNGLINGKPGGNVREGLSSLSAAMEWAEQAADEADPDGVFGEKDRPWHRRKASEKSIGYARMLGIAVGDGARAVEVSDLIDGVLATRTIDPRILPFLAESGRLPAVDTADASPAAVAL